MPVRSWVRVGHCHAVEYSRVVRASSGARRRNHRSGGLASGCSSDTARFIYGTDGMFTGVHHQPAPDHRARPALSRQQPVPAAAIDGSHTGSINRDAVTPVDLSAKPVSQTRWRRLPAPRRRGRSKPLVKLQDSTGNGTSKLDATVDRHVPPARRGRSGRLVAGRRHPGDRQGRRDRLQSVAPLRRAGRRADEDQRAFRRRWPARSARRSSSRPMSTTPRRRFRRPTTTPRSPARNPRAAKSELAGNLPAPAETRPTRSRSCRSRRS